jgi:hypothetical protein
MKKVLIIFFVLLSLSFILMINNKPGETQKNSVVQTQNEPKVLLKMNQNNIYQPQTKTFGAVQVEVTPKQLEPEKQAVFSLSLNTHSVDLGYDYPELANLTDEQGDSYKALSWSGGSGGHHLTGELTFEPLNKTVASITLKLSGIDDQSNSFNWEL